MSVVTACLTCRKITGKPGSFVLRRPLSELPRDVEEFWVYLELRHGKTEKSFTVRVEVEDSRHDVAIDTPEDIFLIDRERTELVFLLAVARDDPVGQYAVHVHVNGSLQWTRVIYCSE